MQAYNTVYVKTLLLQIHSSIIRVRIVRRYKCLSCVAGVHRVRRDFKGMRFVDTCTVYALDSQLCPENLNSRKTTHNIF